MIINGDCELILPDLKIKSNLIITSPPYNVDLGNNANNKNSYDVHDDNMKYEDYLIWMQRIFKLCFDNLEEDGRICVNIGDGKNGSIPTHSDFIQILKEIGFLPITLIIWNKNTISSRTAWGSYMSPSCPSFPRGFEYILVFGKTKKLIHKGESDLTKKEFADFSNGLWTFSPEKNMKKIGHPAMFPIDLPYRLIKMLSYVGDVVLDPFMGSGQTGVVAQLLGRKFIGIEKSIKYCEIAKQRMI